MSCARNPPTRSHQPLEWSDDKERTGEVRVIAVVTAVVNELDQI
jgi:hypothetical protein